MNSFFARLRQRKVMQWSIAYLAGAWVTLQVLDFFGGHFDWSDRVVPAATAFLGVGLIALLVLAWHHGERGQQRVTRGEGVLVGSLLLLAMAAATLTARSEPESPRTDLQVMAGATDTVSAASIAVLPFVNMSSDQENEYFSDGITEELLNALAHVEGLLVAARTSSFAFKGKTLAVSEIGRQLGVAHVLEGSVRKAGDQLRITAQLIKVEDGFHLWSQSYDRPFKDVFAVQEEIAQAITAALRSRIVTAPTSERLVRTTTDNPEAYALYLQGRHLWGKRAEPAVRKAIELYRKALELDPEYALAYAGLADAHLVRANFGWAKPIDAYREVEVNARKALALDSTLAEAHNTLGAVAFYHTYDWPAAEREFRQAIQLDPRYALAHYWYSVFLGTMGRHAESIREAELARRLDPLAPQIGIGVGSAYYDARQYDRALVEYQKVLEIAPDFSNGHAHVAEVLTVLGRFSDAEAALRRAVDLSESSRALSLAFGYARWGKSDQAREFLAAGLKTGGPDYIRASHVATIYAALGDHDEAFRWLERGWTERDPYLSELGIDPSLDALRSDPRFTALLKRMKLPTK